MKARKIKRMKCAQQQRRNQYRQLDAFLKKAWTDAMEKTILHAYQRIFQSYADFVKAMAAAVDQTIAEENRKEQSCPAP